MNRYYRHIVVLWLLRGKEAVARANPRLSWLFPRTKTEFEDCDDADCDGDIHVVTVNPKQSVKATLQLKGLPSPFLTTPLWQMFDPEIERRLKVEVTNKFHWMRYLVNILLILASLLNPCLN